MAVTKFVEDAWNGINSLGSYEREEMALLSIYRQAPELFKFDLMKALHTSSLSKILQGKSDMAKANLAERAIDVILRNAPELVARREAAVVEHYDNW